MDYIKSLRDRIKQKEPKILEKKNLIVNEENNELIGEVNWYWKSEETDWMEIGIVIFNREYWGKGIGFIALKLWIDKIFKLFPEILRLGLSTWSGNIRMIKLAEKLRFKKEAEFRKARIVDHKYYDSISFGILKEEWEEIKRII